MDTPSYVNILFRILQATTGKEVKQRSPQRVGLPKTDMVGPPRQYRERLAQVERDFASIKWVAHAQPTCES